MGVPIEVYELHRYEAAAGCRHDLLLRAARPGWSNADQAAQDAADAFVDSALRHLRGWWERHRLPVDCPRPHTARRLGVLHEVPVGDALCEPGLRSVDIWVAPTGYGAPWVVLGTAPTEDDFWREVGDSDLAALRPRRPAEPCRAYFLTDQDGRGDLTGG